MLSQRLIVIEKTTGCMQDQRPLLVGGIRLRCHCRWRDVTWFDQEENSIRRGFWVKAQWWFSYYKFCMICFKKYIKQTKRNHITSLLLIHYNYRFYIVQVKHCIFTSKYFITIIFLLLTVRFPFSIILPLWSYYVYILSSYFLLEIDVYHSL